MTKKSKDEETSDLSRSVGKENAIEADNQVVFRNLNEEIIEIRNELKETFDDDRVLQYDVEDNDMTSFVCECSDENCKMKLHLSLNDYERVHERDDTFSIANNHEVPEIEQITNKTPRYTVVKKLETPRQTATSLNQTDVDNSPYQA